MNSKFTEAIRIIWTITSKDILDAMKNKTVLGIIVGVAFLMLSSQALPFIMKTNAKPRAFFFDSAKSTVIREIVRSRDLDFHQDESFQDLMESVGGSSIPVLGLVIPTDFDLKLKESSPVFIEGYMIHWASSSETAALITHFEEALSVKTGQQIQILIQDGEVYPGVEILGFSVMIITGLVTGVMTIGLILVPLLITEEKETHTMDALMISPAKTVHILAGKSLAGLFFSLLAAIVMFVFTASWIVHWEVAVLAVLLGGLSTVSLGLLIGSISDNPTTVNLWAGLAIIVLIIPVFLWTSILPKLSFQAKTLLRVLPSVAMSNLINISFTEKYLFREVIINSLILAMFVIIILSLVSWRFRRMDR